jgi:hypothetical protein
LGLVSLCHSRLGAIGVNQNLRNFWAGEFNRRDFAVTQHFAHFRATQADVIRCVVRAGFQGSHAAARLAIKRIFKEEQLDAEFFGRKFAEDFLRVKR